jgi:hypothetical protein
MPSVPFSLPTKGLRKFPVDDSENDIEFMVGDTIYGCPCFIADFLSPRIANLHSIHDTINSFIIDTEGKRTIFPSAFGLVEANPFQ